MEWRGPRGAEAEAGGEGGAREGMKEEEGELKGRIGAAVRTTWRRRDMTSTEVRMSCESFRDSASLA